MSTEVARYRMNPAEDDVLFGDELAEGMWVLPDEALRALDSASEDARLRAERFRQVTKLRRHPGGGGTPPQIAFIGVWVDGYQQAWSGGETWAWIVKRDMPADGGAPS